MTEGLAFALFVTVFVGGLGVLTLAMLTVGVWLLRRNRRVK